MNENKMMSYEMYEELKSSILKTIKTEIANVKPATMPPNNLPQQIEQAVSNGLAQYGTTLDGISESFTAKQTEVLSGVKSLQEMVSAIEIPKELPPRLHNHRHIIGSEAKSIIIFFVTSIVMMIFMAIAVWNAYQPNVQRDDNDLKYRYMKMKGEADAGYDGRVGGSVYTQQRCITHRSNASRCRGVRGDNPPPSRHCRTSPPKSPRGRDARQQGKEYKE